MARQFGVDLGYVPKTYGEFLKMLKDCGVAFYINAGFLIVSKIGTPEHLLRKISAKSFKPITLREMLKMRRKKPC